MVFMVGCSGLADGASVMVGATRGAVGSRAVFRGQLDVIHPVTKESVEARCKKSASFARRTPAEPRCWEGSRAVGPGVASKRRSSDGPAAEPRTAPTLPGGSLLKRRDDSPRGWL